MTNTGKTDIEVPRDRQGIFDPQLIAKSQGRFPVSTTSVSMYARGANTRDITGPPARRFWRGVRRSF
ncbi:transposase [Mesorhizobium sp. LMG 17147]|nr:transposase [Mesorhizobium sp. LMG 17147]